MSLHTCRLWSTSKLFMQDLDIADKDTCASSKGRAVLNTQILGRGRGSGGYLCFLQFLDAQGDVHKTPDVPQQPHYLIQGHAPLPLHVWNTQSHPGQKRWGGPGMCFRRRVTADDGYIRWMQQLSWNSCARSPYQILAYLHLATSSDLILVCSSLPFRRSNLPYL